MTFLPKKTIVKTPPIKSQGIKTKLIPFIMENIHWDGQGHWIEPFLGSGAVLFNVQPPKARVSDTNKYIIDIYQSIQNQRITPLKLKEFLEMEGAELEASAGLHYYKVRDRFNAEGSALDFIFLNRSCFNGVIRFNSKGGFNVPFCKKPERFRQAYVTKICNQVEWVANVMKGKDWVFEVQPWQETIKLATATDFVYLDPPYVGRHTDYFNSWDDVEADELAEKIKNLPCGFAYSMWKQNEYRINNHLIEHFSDFPLFTFNHYYHVGASEVLRNPMEEALILSPKSISQLSPINALY